MHKIIPLLTLALAACAPPSGPGGPATAGGGTSAGPAMSVTRMETRDIGGANSPAATAGPASRAGSQGLPPIIEQSGGGGPGLGSAGMPAASGLRSQPN